MRTKRKETSKSVRTRTIITLLHGAENGSEYKTGIVEFEMIRGTIEREQKSALRIGCERENFRKLLAVNTQASK